MIFMDSFIAKLKEYGNCVESYLNDKYSCSRGIPERLLKAMLYTLNAGGKRIRPALCLSWHELIKGYAMDILPFAAALEMIHTYSLIHDDLPAMDNDDLRRGKPTCHKAFDEATAILAGDALLTDAFSVAIESSADSLLLLDAINLLSQAAGSKGMVGGQILDISYADDTNITLEKLEKMERMKTGALIRTACTCGAILANATELQKQAANIYGSCLGRAFQIVDDILDVNGTPEEMGKNSGNDKEMGKTTWVDLYGAEKSYLMAEKIIGEGISALSIFPEDKTGFLMGLAQYVLQRRV